MAIIAKQKWFLIVLWQNLKGQKYQFVNVFLFHSWYRKYFAIITSSSKWIFFAISSSAKTEETTYDIRNTTTVTYLFKSRKCDAIATWKPPWNGHNFWPKCNFQVPRLTSALNQGEIWHQHPTELQPHKNDNNQSIHNGVKSFWGKHSKISGYSRV